MTEQKTITITLDKKDQELIDSESKELAHELLKELSLQKNPKHHIMQELMLKQAAMIILTSMVAVRSKAFPEGPKRNSIVLDMANDIRDNIVDMTKQVESHMASKA